MRDDHGLSTAHMIPQRTLTSLHEEEHAERDSQPWYGSPDASSNTGFIANRWNVVTSMLHYDPHTREVLPLHMMSHHGWSADEVREATEWPEAANVLPRHHDAEHSVPRHEHVAVPHAHEDVSHQWPPPEPDETDPWDEFGRS
jgi:hypothetical protein